MKKLNDEKDKVGQNTIINKMLETGETSGAASGAHEFFNQPHDQFFSFLKTKNNDLSWQCDIVTKDFCSYLETGSAPPPYYPWRIAIILSKQKMKTKEIEFLNAWCRHFSNLKRYGSRYRDLVERAEKRGIFQT